MKKQKNLLLILLCIGILAMSFMLISCGECKHEWGEWATTGLVYCDGSEEARTCSLCGQTETRTQGGDYSLHEWSEWTTTAEATCTEDGAKERFCSKCPRVEAEVISKTGHTDTIICTNCQMQTVVIPEINIEDLEQNIVVKVTDFNLSITDIYDLEDDYTASMINIAEGYITIDENDNIYGYGDGTIKFDGTHTGVHNEFDAAIYFLDGYIYYMVDGAPEYDSTLSTTLISRVMLSQKSTDEIKDAVEKSEEAYPAIQEWLTGSFMPLFENIDLDKYPQDVQTLIIDAINSAFVRTENENGTVSYKINYEAAYEVADLLCDEPFSTYVDMIYGEGTFEAVKDFVTADEFYAYDVFELLNYIEVEQGVDLEAFFDALDSLAAIVLDDDEATFEELLSKAEPLPEGFDIYDFISDGNLAQMTVMDAILLALEVEDDPETPDVDESAEAQDLIKNTVLDYFEMFETLSFAELCCEAEDADDIEDVRKAMYDVIDMYTEPFDFELCLNADNTFNSAVFTQTVNDSEYELEGKFEIKITDKIDVSLSQKREDTSINIKGEILLDEALDIDQDTVDKLLAPFTIDDKITTENVYKCLTELNEYSTRYYYFINGEIYSFYINRYNYVADADAENSYYNAEIGIEKFTGECIQIDSVEKCGGGYAYSASISFCKTEERYYTIENVLAPKDAWGSEIRDKIDFEALDLDALGVVFDESDTTSKSIYFTVDGEEVNPFSSSDPFYDSMHDYEYNEDLSIKDVECGTVYYKVYVCTECGESYNRYYSNSHEYYRRYFYENGTYYVKKVCSNCDDVREDWINSINIETDLEIDYYDCNKFAGFTFECTKENAGKYTIELDNYDFAQVTVYEIVGDNLYIVDSDYSFGSYDEFSITTDLSAGQTYVFALETYLYNSSSTDIIANFYAAPDGMNEIY